MEHEIHLEPPSPVRCQKRTSFHRASSAHSEQQPGWGQDFLCPHPIPTAESVLHLAGRFFPPGIDLGNHPMVANVSSTALQRFTPWVCVAAPKDHARTWTASYSKLAPSLRRFEPKPYFHEADYCPAPGDHTRRPETFPV